MQWILGRKRYLSLKHVVKSWLLANFIILFLPAFSVIYAGLFTEYRSEWQLFRTYPNFTEYAFFASLALPLVILQIRYYFPSKNADKVLEDFLTCINAIVRVKTRRFQKGLKKVTPTGDTFSIITDPKMQIEIITNSLVGFICKNYGLKDENVDVTVMSQYPNEEWELFHEYQDNWERLGPAVIMNGNSTAAHCLKYGQPVFFPDKMIAESEGKYIMSGRDQEHEKIGSIYSYPIKLKKEGITYIVSIVTYEKVICQFFNDREMSITKELLGGFCRRYELELCLDAIKYLKRNSHE